MEKRKNETLEKMERGGNWLLENKNARNYIFYAANLVINPLRALVGIAGKAYESIASQSYRNNESFVNVARAGIAVLTVLDLMHYSGLVDTLGDALLTSALITDTSYWEKKSLAGVGEDVGRITSGVKDLSDRLER